MAAQKKTASGNRNGVQGNRKTNRTGKAKTEAARQEQIKEQQLSEAFQKEIILWLVIAFSMLLFISNLGIGGNVGNAISGFLFGVFGLLAYVFPILLLLGSFFGVSNKGNTLAVVKLVSAIIFTLFFCLFLSLTMCHGTVLTPIQAFTESRSTKSGGGFIGGILTYLFVPGFGLLGAYIIDIIVLIISLVLMTGKSAMKGMKQSGKKVYETAKVKNEQYQEFRENRSRERAARRIDNKVSGVSIDTKILDQGELPQFQQDLEEIHTDGFFTIPKETMMQEVSPISLSVFPEREERRHRDSAEDEIDLFNTPLKDLFGGQENGPQEYEPQPIHTVEAAKVSAPLMSSSVTEPKIERHRLESDKEKLDTKASNRKASDTKASDTKASDREEPDKNEFDLEDEITPLEVGFEPQPLHTLEPMEAWKEEHHALEVVKLQEKEHHALEAVELQEKEHHALESTEAWEEEKPAFESIDAWEEELEQDSFQVLDTEDEDFDEEVESETPAKPPKPVYQYPTSDLLNPVNRNQKGDSDQHLMETVGKLQQTLKNFGVDADVVDYSCGPAVTRFEIQPKMGVKVSKIVNLADDIKLNLAAADIRIEAPIPGKPAVGIEVPNKENVMVSFRELIESEEFKESKSSISFAVGKDIAGKVMVSDIAKMPHVLIAGATGSGKSVCINTIIMSILFKADPSEVKLIMIDPKVVELSVYNGIPHLMIPVVTEPKKAAGALNWAVAEMMDRYNKFAECNVRNIKGYNSKVDSVEVPEGQERPEKMPQIVIIVDELADLMMVASKEVEEAICRLAQLARAAGIHLIIATQRPSVNVITGLIKANMPSRIAFAVTSGVDSRTILDSVGAEKLLGKGDMLFSPHGAPKPMRVQGAFVSDEEVQNVVDYIIEHNGNASYSSDMQQKMENMQTSASSTAISDSDVEDDGRDSHFMEAAQILMDKDRASIGMLQRYLKVGFNRAARIMDQLAEAGIVGPEEGTKPRKVLMTPEEFQTFIDENS